MATRSKPQTMLNHLTHGGSRQFVELPESASFDRMRDHIAGLGGVAITGFLSDDVTETWIDFTFRGHQFTINNQFGDYWFFVADPCCPDDVLQAVVRHCEALLCR